jgi:hypothetical protein
MDNLMLLYKDIIEVVFIIAEMILKQGCPIMNLNRRISNVNRATYIMRAYLENSESDNTGIALYYFYERKYSFFLDAEAFMQPKLCHGAWNIGYS